jgi:hypothetical protein
MEIIDILIVIDIFCILTAMEIRTRNIIIDTSYVVQNVFDFNKTELQKLRKLIDKDSAKLYLTDITVAEVHKKISELISTAWKRLDTGDGRYLKPIPVFKNLLKEYNEEKLVAVVKANFENFLKSLNVQIIKSDEVNVLQIYEMYVRQELPFSDKKKKEFADAFVLEAIRIWHENTGSSAYIISNDDDWQMYIKTLEKKKSEEDPVLLYLKDLSTFIDSIIREDEELENYVKFTDRLLTENWNEIKNCILEEFKFSEFQSNGISEEEIDNVYATDCRLFSSDILEVTNRFATYELSLEIDVIAGFSVPDYNNAFYDKEDDRFYNLDYTKIYSSQVLSENCTIEFSFNSDIENSFKIIKAEFDNDEIRLSFDEDDFINIDEWTKSLKVSLVGVENNEITKSGTGSMEFENLAKAQEVFPELNIKNGSKNFTAALGSKIGEPLRFETWKAYELYST